MYEYKVKEVIKVYDGDTITVILDLGFNVTKLEIIRFAWINAPELRGEEHDQGIISRDFVREQIKKAENITIKTFKDHKGKYGRYIGEVYVDGVNLNKMLVSEGLAEYKKY